MCKGVQLRIFAAQYTSRNRLNEGTVYQAFVQARREPCITHIGAFFEGGGRRNKRPLSHFEIFEAYSMAVEYGTTSASF